MDEKYVSDLRAHILEFGDQKLIDMSYGKCEFEDVVLDIMKEKKDYGSYMFVGELLINVPRTKVLTEIEFFGGFIENKHYFVIDSKEKAEKVREKFVEIRDSIVEDVRVYLKEEYRDNTEIIEKVKVLVNRKSEIKNRKISYNLMTEALKYVKDRKTLSALFKVGINYYKSLETEFKKEVING